MARATHEVMMAVGIRQEMALTTLRPAALERAGHQSFLTPRAMLVNTASVA